MVNNQYLILLILCIHASSPRQEKCSLLCAIHGEIGLKSVAIKTKPSEHGGMKWQLRRNPS